MKRVSQRSIRIRGSSASTARHTWAAKSGTVARSASPCTAMTVASSVCSTSTEKRTALGRRFPTPRPSSGWSVEGQPRPDGRVVAQAALAEVVAVVALLDAHATNEDVVEPPAHLHVGVDPAAVAARVAVERPERVDPVVL